jgi:putative acetyltransferase
MKIRTEAPGDRPAVRALHLTAFETRAEADLVDALRDRARPLISLIAEEAGEIVGHILFSPVTLEEHGGLRIMGLAPMAVLPSHQGEGVGSTLVDEGLAHCRKEGFDAVVVLGHPGYYPRFGFQPASRFGIRSEYEVPDEAFMILELRAGALTGVAGTVHYHPAFNELG